MTSGLNLSVLMGLSSSRIRADSPASGGGYGPVGREPRDARCCSCLRAESLPGTFAAWIGRGFLSEDVSGSDFLRAATRLARSRWLSPEIGVATFLVLSPPEASR